MAVLLLEVGVVADADGVGLLRVEQFRRVKRFVVVRHCRLLPVPPLVEAFRVFALEEVALEQRLLLLDTEVGVRQQSVPQAGEQHDQDEQGDGDEGHEAPNGSAGPNEEEGGPRRANHKANALPRANLLREVKLLAPLGHQACDLELEAHRAQCVAEGSQRQPRSQSFLH